MLTVGDTFPSFNLIAIGAFGAKMDFHNLSCNLQDNWLVVVAWPLDFTHVCPTEILGYNELYHEFEEAGGRLVGLSTDHHPSHLAWRQSREDLFNVHFSWLSDGAHRLSKALGILKPDGTCMRATFIIDDKMMIRYVTVHDELVGRSPEETLRVLHALRTNELTPCGWKKGELTL
jgi:alkyl hydroperoxide reductase subunit AhpC